MALKLSELVNETQAGTVEVGGEEVHFTYYLHDSVEMNSEALAEERVTKEDIDAAAEKDSDPFLRNAVLLAFRIKSWDWHFETPEGGREPLPLNTATFKRLRGRYFKPLWEAVYGKPDEEVPSEPSPSQSG